MSAMRNLLSGHAGDSQAIGGFSLPDVERAVCRGRELESWLYTAFDVSMALVARPRIPIDLRPEALRHSDILRSVRGEGGRAVVCRPNRRHQEHRTASSSAIL